MSTFHNSERKSIGKTGCSSRAVKARRTPTLKEAIKIYRQVFCVYKCDISDRESLLEDITEVVEAKNIYEACYYLDYKMWGFKVDDVRKIRRLWKEMCNGKS